MATRGLIVQKKGEFYVSVYNHWDSYPRHLGFILQKHFNSQNRIDALFDLCEKERAVISSICITGNIVRLNKSNVGLTKKVDDVGAISVYGDAEWIYVWEDDKWSVYNSDDDFKNKFDLSHFLNEEIMNQEINVEEEEQLYKNNSNCIYSNRFMVVNL